MKDNKCKPHLINSHTKKCEGCGKARNEIKNGFFNKDVKITISVTCHWCKGKSNVYEECGYCLDAGSTEKQWTLEDLKKALSDTEPY